MFDDNDLQPRVHINAVGSYTPDRSEVPPATVQRAHVVVDHRQAAWAEAGDLIQPRNTGLIDESHIQAELGELLVDAGCHLPQPAAVTLFKSVGHSVQDAAAAGCVLHNAHTLDCGQVIDW